MSIKLDVTFPEWAEFLFKPARIKCAHGGRGSGKSWAFARALIALAVSQPVRILCTREVQKSIKDSVKRLLDDQIEAMGLESAFDSLETEIRGRNGSLILFSGLSNQTADSIKSYEGIDVCWIEEAQSITKKSLDILTPTIRKDDSEIWITFNPLLDTDEVWRRYVENPPPGAVVKQVNWSDNPWFPQVLEQEREHCKLTDKESYDNIWEGKCRPTVVGAIWAREVENLMAQGRYRPMEYDPMLQVHTVWDLGWADSMTIGFVQRAASEVRLIDYIEGSFRTLEDYVKDIKTRPWNWGNDWIPHDGRARDFKSGMSTEEMLKKLGRNPMIVPQIGVEEGIKATRLVIPRLWMNSNTCAQPLEHMKRYRRTINPQTNQPGPPLHDEHSHCGDMIRYLAVVIDQITNEAYTAPHVSVPVVDSTIGY